MPRPRRAAIAAESYPSPDSEEEMASPSTSRRQRDNTIMDAEWDAVKEEIGRLYLDENICLKDVIIRLREKRGFCATEKQYKNTLNKWRFWKNNRREDMAAVVALEESRRAQGKASIFTRHGRPLNPDTYLRRKGIERKDLLREGRLGDLPPRVQCRTPPPPPPPPPTSPPFLRVLRMPDDFDLQEAYLHWTLGHPLLPPQIDADYFCELDRYHQSEAVRAVALFTHGCWLFSIGKSTEGGAFCRSAFEGISHVLESSSQFAIYELMGAIARYPLIEIHRMLWSYLAKWAKMPDRADEKVRRMLRAFARFSKTAGFDDSIAMLQWGRQVSSQQSNGTFDGKPFDYTLIKPWDVLPMNRAAYHRYYMNRALWKADMIPTATLSSPDRDPDPWPLRADLLVIFGNQTGWNDDRIEGIAIMMLKGMSPNRPPGYPQFICYYALAQMNRERCLAKRCQAACDHSQARRNLAYAADVQSKAWSPGKNYYETLTLLEKWHLEAGDVEAARATRLQRDEKCQGAFKNLYL